MKKTGIVILARMGSRRFPGKSLAKIAGRELLGIILDRVRYLAPNHECCVATSVMPQDDLIEDFCALENVPCYRGMNHEWPIALWLPRRSTGLNMHSA